MSISIDQVNKFLFEEARYLDDKEWDSWLEMYAEDASYWVPSWDDTGELTEDPQTEISLMYYASRSGLEDRVFRINTDKSSATSLPQPRTSHNLSNIEIVEASDEQCNVRFNWVNYAYRYEHVYTYFGTSFYTLDISGERPKIKAKKVVLKNDYIHHVVDIYHL
ncbi:MAG: benzoate 1,2-dioxygenase small subunit [Oceanospirillales bacterium]|nr:benzoate 1,2-dioxygenase small subunit [Oceanospirillales bacterium]MBR9889443.1 benzoate 1,2-dioxygenase small subunit [Oceanospirillales bacterium]